MTWALEDIVKDINEQEPIPGVKLEVVNYDTAFNPARFLTGYDYLKSKGAQVIISVFNDASETLKPYAAEDKIAVLGMATSVPMVDPAGWVFAFSAPTRWSIKSMLKWVSDDWDYDAARERSPPWPQSAGMTTGGRTTPAGRRSSARTIQPSSTTWAASCRLLAIQALVRRHSQDQERGLHQHSRQRGPHARHLLEGVQGRRRHGSQHRHRGPECLRRLHHRLLRLELPRRQAERSGLGLVEPGLGMRPSTSRTSCTSTILTKPTA